MLFGSWRTSQSWKLRLLPSSEGIRAAVVQVRWLMGAPAGLKLHAELSALLGGATLTALHWAAALAARLAPLLPWLLGDWSIFSTTTVGHSFTIEWGPGGCVALFRGSGHGAHQACVVIVSRRSAFDAMIS